MSETPPTARELLDICEAEIEDWLMPPSHMALNLAARVEKVLALVEPISRAAVPCADLARRVRRILDGVEG